MSPKICIGTAQLGSDYGVTNKIGRVNDQEARTIFDLAARNGIKDIDTAQDYGDAESVLGRVLPGGHEFAITTKLGRQANQRHKSSDAAHWENTIRNSLRDLGLEKVDTLLVHNTQDLKKEGGHYLTKWLVGLKERGLARRLGISIYDADETAGISEELKEVVQLPVSLYDQRLLEDETIKKLHDAGSAIQVRSVYLQGLLVTPSSNWPKWTSSTARSVQTRLEAAALSEGHSLLEMALGFIKYQDSFESVAIGISCVSELEELLNAWDRAYCWNPKDTRQWAINELATIDPRRWPRLTQ